MSQIKLILNQSTGSQCDDNRCTLTENGVIVPIGPFSCDADQPNKVLTGYRRLVGPLSNNSDGSEGDDILPCIDMDGVLGIPGARVPYKVALAEGGEQTPLLPEADKPYTRVNPYVGLITAPTRSPTGVTPTSQQTYANNPYAKWGKYDFCEACTGFWESIDGEVCKERDPVNAPGAFTIKRRYKLTNVGTPKADGSLSCPVAANTEREDFPCPSDVCNFTAVPLASALECDVSSGKQIVGFVTVQNTIAPCLLSSISIPPSLATGESWEIFPEEGIDPGRAQLIDEFSPFTIHASNEIITIGEMRRIPGAAAFLRGLTTDSFVSIGGSSYLQFSQAAGAGIPLNAEIRVIPDFDNSENPVTLNIDNAVEKMNGLANLLDDTTDGTLADKQVSYRTLRFVI